MNVSVLYTGSPVGHSRNSLTQNVRRRIFFFFYFRDLTTKLLTLEGRALVAFDEIVYEFLDAGDGASNEASEPD